MSPRELKEYLEVLRGARLASAHVEFGDVKIAVVFEPEMKLEAVDPSPGGWKSPRGLDAPSEVDP